MASVAGAPGEAPQARGELPGCDCAAEMTGITSFFRGGRPPPNISSLQPGEDEMAVPRICDG
jgi:hypothetical protein